MAKTGPKAHKYYDPEVIKAAIKRGIKHGLSLYSYGCRCKICGEQKKISAKKQRAKQSTFSLNDRPKKKKVYVEKERDINEPLPIGVFGINF